MGVLVALKEDEKQHLLKWSIS